MTFIHVFSHVLADDVAYTLGLLPVCIYFFTFGPGCHLGRHAHIAHGMPVGLVWSATSLKIVHLALRTKGWTPLVWLHILYCHTDMVTLYCH